MKPKIIAVVGHTASGKTGLAIRLAERLGGEIVCCDSMQIYRIMDVGTAKPTPGELARVPHHVVDFVDPMREYSCADYAVDADSAIKDILSRGKLPIICGGTGLYLDSLLFERPFDESGGKSEVRERLCREVAEEGGAHALYLRLCEIDPESAAKTHENNVRRVIRALEIYETTGKKKSDLDAIESPSKYDFLAFELRRTDKDERYARIEQRCDEMIASGLLGETEKLLKMGIFEKNPTAAQAIGYKEMLGCVRGDMTLADARERLCIATRQYAKRQITWFGAKKYIETVELTADMPDPTDSICAKVREWLEK